MKTAVFQYRCRRCGELYDSGLETGASRADHVLIAAMHKMAVGNDLVLPLLDVHTSCVVDGVTGTGMADLAGYKVKE